MKFTVKNRFIDPVINGTLTHLIVEEMPEYDEKITIYTEDNVILVDTLCRSVSSIKVDPNKRQVYMLFNDAWCKFVDPAFSHLIKNAGFVSTVDFFTYHTKPFTGYLLEFLTYPHQVNPDL